VTGLALSVIIPNWNGQRFLEPLLKQIRQQTYPVSDILVIDNGSTDRSREVAAEAGARVLALGHNAGFAAAVNRGVQAVQSPLIAILNNDLELPPRYLELLVAAIDGGADLASGKLLQASRRDSLDGAYDLVARSGCAWRAGHNGKDGPEWNERRDRRILPFTAIVVRREAYQEVGGLDESFGSYLEDVDFGLRSASKGYNAAYVPEAVAFHFGSGTRGAWHPATVRQIARNQVLLVAKHQGRPGLRRHGMAIAIGQGLWGLLALRHGRGWAWLRGKIDGLRQARSLWGSGDENARMIMAANEQEIAEQQRRSATPDRYWRWYFNLAGLPRREEAS
jgi:GT2 family glycosyltransferase